jgi:hypothetical protein
MTPITVTIEERHIDKALAAMELDQCDIVFRCVIAQALLEATGKKISVGYQNIFICVDGEEMFCKEAVNLVRLASDAELAAGAVELRKLLPKTLTYR